VTPESSDADLRSLCSKLDIELQPSWGHGQIILEMHEHLSERKAHEPTFFRDFPVEVSPLTRQHRTNPRLAEKWDLVIFGMEVATAYSELVDPVIQRERLTAQSLLAAGGDPEAMQLDEDFLRALEYAMPPTGGMGMGIDRLMIMLTGESIRETTLFPFVRPGT
jgi:lysyl-tRNA synthetase class 2